MKLLVCDLDGTLTRTVAVDEECFVRAFADAFSIQDLNTNWTDCEHVTNLGVLHHVFRSKFQRMPAQDDIVCFAEHLLRLITDRHALNKDSFAEIPGASSLLASTHAEWRVAIATGCFEASARFKMGAAQLPAKDIPAAFAEDGPSRESIVRAAIERAKAEYRVRHFERIVSVGDAVWDVRAARRLQLPFVGVGTGQRAVSLREEGAGTGYWKLSRSRALLRVFRPSSHTGE